MKSKTLSKNMKMGKINKILSMENILGLLLAVLILTDYKMNSEIISFINSPLGIVLCLIVVILLFLFMHPILGLLLLIFLYENVRYLNKMFKLPPKSETKEAKNKMKSLNKGSYNTTVENDVITTMAPIHKTIENPNAKFIPVVDETIPSKIV